MVSLSFCDNCNVTVGRPRTVTISWAMSDSAPVWPQRKMHGLCESCATMLASLDLAGFAEAHHRRPRTVGLP